MTSQFFAVVDETKVPVTAPAAATSPRKASAASGFDGLSAPWTYFVARPDQSIAAGPNGILQMINGGFVALYDRSGHLVAGWPKDAGQFFGLARGSPFVDHRALYDAWSNRYWLISGDQKSILVYLAVSQTANPNGKWNVYGFPASPSPKQFWDFNMFGVDRDTVSYSTNLFPYQGYRLPASNVIYDIPKTPIEHGSKDVTVNGFTNVAVNGKAPVALEPVVVNPSTGATPPGELFLATPDTQVCRGGCRAMYVFLISGGKLTMATVPTPPIRWGPLADTPACHRCLEAPPLTMTTSGVYYNGLVYFAFGVGVPSSTGTPGIFWGALQPRFSRKSLDDAPLVQHGVVTFNNNQAAFFPSVMVDAKGNLFLLFDSSGPALNPSIYLATRRPNDAAGVMTSMKLLKRGTATPPSHYLHYNWFPYGDYTATSFDPSTGVWIASQYPQSSLVYGTYIANVRL